MYAIFDSSMRLCYIPYVLGLYARSAEQCANYLVYSVTHSYGIPYPSGLRLGQRLYSLHLIHSDEENFQVVLMQTLGLRVYTV